MGRHRSRSTSRRKERDRSKAKKEKKTGRSVMDKFGEFDISVPVAGSLAMPPPPPPQQFGEAALPPPPGLSKEKMQLTIAGGGQIILAPPPQINPELVRLAREARRVHVSNIPKEVTKLELTDLFTVEAARLRRLKTEKQTGKTIDPSVIIEIDKVLDVYIDATKSLPFSFIEMSTEDITDDLLEHEDEIKYRSQITGREYDLKIKRPRDHRTLPGVDHTKAVVIGMPPSLGEEAVKEVFESYGPVKNFQMKGGYCYGEFDNDVPVREMIEDFSGEVLVNRLIVVFPLTDCLRAQVMNAGISVTPADDDGAVTSFLTVDDQDYLKDILTKLAEPTQRPATMAVAAKYPHLTPPFGYAVPVFPTRILMLLNMVDEDVLDDDSEYYRLIADVAEEVEQYGRVKEIKIPRPVAKPQPPKFVPRDIQKPTRVVNLLPLQTPFGDGTDAAHQRSPEEIEYELLVQEEEKRKEEFEQEKELYLHLLEQWNLDQDDPVKGGFGRIFVEYETVEEAALAQRMLCGRLFDGRTIITSFLLEDIMYPPPPDEDAAVNDYLEKNVGEEAGDKSTPQPEGEEGPATPKEEEIGDID